MSPILHFRKQLTGPPVATEVPGIRVRNMQVPDDIPGWLALRDRAMATERPATRSWREADFRAEMTSKPWWRADHCWVAVSRQQNEPSQAPLGAVTLALRSGESSEVPVVHWLLVDPMQRRRGIGRALIEHLERAAWETGWREVQLETHVGWGAAVAFYQSMGYAEFPERSLR
jgi:GNAT superfamily N-acetyltransferase